MDWHLQQSDFHSPNVTILHVANLTDKTNYAYDEANSPVPGILLYKHVLLYF